MKTYFYVFHTGWGGGGLGSSEQGRVDPIEAAEVRDRTDMYKGIGTSMTDPFEQFRKSKSQGYTNRMRVSDAFFSILEI